MWSSRIRVHIRCIQWTGSWSWRAVTCNTSTIFSSPCLDRSSPSRPSVLLFSSSHPQAPIIVPRSTPLLTRSAATTTESPSSTSRPTPSSVSPWFPLFHGFPCRSIRGVTPSLRGPFRRPSWRTTASSTATTSVWSPCSASRSSSPGVSTIDVSGGGSPREKRGGELLERVVGEGRDGTGRGVVRSAQRRGFAKRERNANHLEGRKGVRACGYPRECAEYEGTHRVPGSGDHRGKGNDLFGPADQRGLRNRTVAWSGDREDREGQDWVFDDAPNDRGNRGFGDYPRVFECESEGNSEIGAGADGCGDRAGQQRRILRVEWRWEGISKDSLLSVCLFEYNWMNVDGGLRCEGRRDSEFLYEVIWNRFFCEVERNKWIICRILCYWLGKTLLPQK